MLTRAQRKAMLLQNRLEELVKARAPIDDAGTKIIKPGGRAYFLEDTAGTSFPEEGLLKTSELDAWTKGRDPKRGGDEKQGGLEKLDVVARLISVADAPRDNAVSDDNFRVFEFGRSIGLDEGRVRYAIDTKVAGNFPMFRTVVKKQAEAKRFCEDYSGCYLLYRHDMNSAVDISEFPLGILVRAPITIRYPVPYKAYSQQREVTKRIRCKLNIPDYRQSADGGVFKYDGVVGRGRSWWTWLFQGRFNPHSELTEDLILMYTQAFGADNDIARGALFTQSQTDEETPSVATVALIRKPGYELKKGKDSNQDSYLYLHPDEKPFMQASPRAINLADKNEWDDDDARAIELIRGSAPGSGDGNVNGLGLH